MYKFQAQITFTWGDVLENNIKSYPDTLLNNLNFRIKLVLWQSFIFVTQTLQKQLKEFN